MAPEMLFLLSWASLIPELQGNKFLFSVNYPGCGILLERHGGTKTPFHRSYSSCLLEIKHPQPLLLKANHLTQEVNV